MVETAKADNSRRWTRYQGIDGLEIKVAKPAFFPEWKPVRVLDYSLRGVGFLMKENEFEVGDEILLSVTLFSESGKKLYSATKVPAEVRSKRNYEKEVETERWVGFKRYGVQMNVDGSRRGLKFQEALGRIAGYVSRTVGE